MRENLSGVPKRSKRATKKEKKMFLIQIFAVKVSFHRNMIIVIFIFSPDTDIFNSAFPCSKNRQAFLRVYKLL